jgi:hypothetical protein
MRHILTSYRYLDQPVQVGLSYDKLTNVTYNVDTGAVRVANFSNSVPAQNNSFYVGTYPSENYNFTTRGTENSARALWHFAQVWFQEFPQVSHDLLSQAPFFSSDPSIYSQVFQPANVLLYFYSISPMMTESPLPPRATAVAMDQPLQHTSRSRTSGS